MFNQNKKCTNQKHIKFTMCIMSFLFTFIGFTLTGFAVTGPIRSFPIPDDRTFVRDNDPSALDTGCTYATDGPLRITLPVNRVIDKSSNDGTISEEKSQILIQKGYLSKYATLKISAFDVDLASGEIDKIYFNGVEVGVLSGEDSRWKVSEFQIPIHLVKFGNINSQGGESIENINVIEIHIDTASTPDDHNWCVSADWVALEFKAMSPIVLIHGNNSSGQFFKDNNFTDTLDEAGLLYDNSINLIPGSNTIAGNARQLRARISIILDKYGVDSIHIVAHSKGGLDTRRFLVDWYNSGRLYQPKILSFTTLSTPHNGTAAADMSRNYVKSVEEKAKIQYQNIGPMQQLLAYINYKKYGSDEGQKSFTTQAAAQFNSTNIDDLKRLQNSAKLKTRFGTVGADADINDSHTIDLNQEFSALMTAGNSKVINWLIINPFSKSGFNQIYQMMRNNKEITLEFGVSNAGNKIAKIKGVPPNPGPILNDVLVSMESARGRNSFETLVTDNKLFLTGSYGRNHASVADAGVAEFILPWFKEAEEYDGDLK